MEPTEENVRAWDEAHRAPHGEEEPGLPEAVRERLPGLDGRHVLQLGGGPARAAELAALGAMVTAVEPEAEAIAAGHELAPTAAWIQSDLHGLPLELQRGRFHLVLADTAALREPKPWAGGIEAALRPGGYVLAFGEHPAATALDPALRWRGDYFEGPAPTLGAIVTALARAGLVVRRLEELPSLRPQRRPTPFPGAYVLVAARRPRSA
jgi:hypothetical protein